MSFKIQCQIQGALAGHREAKQKQEEDTSSFPGTGDNPIVLDTKYCFQQLSRKMLRLRHHMIQLMDVWFEYVSLSFLVSMFMEYDRYIGYFVVKANESLVLPIPIFNVVTETHNIGLLWFENSSKYHHIGDLVSSMEYPPGF
jgi:hypothetical protein